MANGTLRLEDLAVVSALDGEGGGRGSLLQQVLIAVVVPF